MLIYIPHGSLNRDFISLVRDTSKVPLDTISDELLYQYLYHECDIGTKEIGHKIIPHFQKSPYSFGILTVNIPRGFCDLNRPKS